MEWPMKMLERADFSRETDLKQRLRARLTAKMAAMSGRIALSDDEVEWVNAAGDPDAMNPKERTLIDPKENGQ